MPIPLLDSVTDDTLFDISQNVTLLAWIPLILFPKSKVKDPIVWTAVLANAVLYTLTFGSILASKDDGEATVSFMDMGSYNGVRSLFQDKDHPEIILPAWVHYLAFDMVVANFLVEKNLADPSGLPHVLMVPILLLVLMAGPAGVLAYFLLSAVSHTLRSAPADSSEKRA